VRAGNLDRQSREAPRLPSGMAEFDRVTGDDFVRLGVMHNQQFAADLIKAVGALL
jgi:hypothetical protein